MVTTPIPGAGTCAVEGCDKAARRGQLMCRTCWYRVTPGTRAAVNANYRGYLDGRVSLAELRASQEQAAREAEA